MPGLRVTGNVLRRLDCFHPLVDIPQIYPTWVTFAEGCSVFQLSTSERLPLPRYQQRRKPDTYIFFQTYSPGGATIGSPICTGTIHQCTFSSSSYFDGVALSRFRIISERTSTECPFVYDQLFAVVIVFRRAARVGPRADPLPSLHRRYPAATPAPSESDDTPQLGV